MTEFICLGGPWHGRFVDPRGRMTLSAPMLSRLSAGLVSDAAEPDSMPLPRKVTYHRSRVLVAGWRFPLDCMTNWALDMKVPDGVVLPGYVHGVPGEHEPDRNAPPAQCRCEKVAVVEALRHVMGLPALWSACHLDHCPLHGPFRPKGHPT